VTQLEVAQPPTATEGTVTLDVTEGTAQVRRITEVRLLPGERYRQSLGSRAPGDGSDIPTDTEPPRALEATPLCQTPCVVNLPRGYHHLEFVDAHVVPPRASTAFVYAAARPSIARHALGLRDVSADADTAFFFSMASAILALTFGGLGVGMLLRGEDSRGEDERLPGAVFLGLGIASGIAAWLLAYLPRTRIQAGATTQWTP